MLDGGAVGFGVAAIDRGWTELGSVVIDEKHRGKGLGRALLTSLLGWAADQTVDRAFLQVDVANATALALYRSLGFEVLYDYDTLSLK
jgi:N-acetylglutamate synthase